MNSRCNLEFKKKGKTLNASWNDHYASFKKKLTIKK